METATISLSKGQTATVDQEDFQKLSAYRWYAKERIRAGNTVWVAVTTGAFGGRRYFIGMHQMLVQAIPPLVIDHINGDGLDNRKSNLRICTRSQNNQNRCRETPNTTSRYRGVFKYYNGKWLARIKLNGKQLHLGYYEDEVDAALAYNNAAVVMFGKFANPNKIK